MSRRWITRLAVLLLVVVAGWATMRACHTPQLRIDGTTPESFARTRDAMLASRPRTITAEEYGALSVHLWFPEPGETDAGFRGRMHNKTAREIVDWHARQFPPAPTPAPQPTTP